VQNIAKSTSLNSGKICETVTGISSNGKQVASKTVMHSKNISVLQL